jgi:hypothetical protein
MYRADLDLLIHFVPPMDEGRQGITLTRSLELPFPPASEVSIYSKHIDDGPDPLGFRLKDVTWDMDRQLFVAKTYLIISGVPWPLIPSDLRRWLDRGWHWGSYLDAYQEEEEDEPETLAVKPLQGRGRLSLNDDDEMEAMPTQPPVSRPKRFNEVFGAMLRLMVELHNNEADAYAMHKTGMFFTEEQLKKDDSPTARRWQHENYAYSQMPWEKQLAWCKRVVKNYPTLKSLVDRA